MTALSSTAAGRGPGRSPPGPGGRWPRGTRTAGASSRPRRPSRPARRARWPRAAGAPAHAAPAGLPQPAVGEPGEVHRGHGQEEARARRDGRADHHGPAGGEPLGESTHQRCEHDDDGRVEQAEDMADGLRPEPSEDAQPVPQGVPAGEDERPGQAHAGIGRWYFGHTHPDRRRLDALARVSPANRRCWISRTSPFVICPRGLVRVRGLNSRLGLGSIFGRTAASPRAGAAHRIETGGSTRSLLPCTGAF